MYSTMTSHPAGELLRSHDEGFSGLSWPCGHAGILDGLLGPCRLPPWAADPAEAVVAMSLAGRRGQAPMTSASSPRPGILLDRDGTIIVDHGYVGAVDCVDFIEGAPEAIAKFNRANVPVAVVTNQAGVARGYYGIDDVTKVHRHIVERLADYGAHIDLFLFSPYHPEGVVKAFAHTSEDRKPGPGMAKAAAAALNLDLTASWVVGDRPEDIGMAAAIGASAIYLGPDDCRRPGVWPFPSLAVAATFILERITV